MLIFLTRENILYWTIRVVKNFKSDIGLYIVPYYRNMYSEVCLDGELKRYSIDGKAEIKNLSSINLLIGRNNSGKSFFLRELFVRYDLKFIGRNKDFYRVDEYLIKLIEAAKSVSTKFAEQNWSMYGNISRVAALKAIGYWHHQTTIVNIWTEVSNLYNFFLGIGPGQAQQPDFIYARRMLYSLVEKVLELLPNGDIKPTIPKKIYVPVLRGLRPIQVINNGKFDGDIDNYSARTIHDYFTEGEHLKISEESSKVVTGLHLYREVQRLLLGSLSDRQKIAKFEKFISDNFFNGQTFSLIPRYNSDVLHIRLGDNEDDERPIFSLGDGIQSIIILTYPLFFYNDDDVIVFYEEPETHLHPGLQRLFIETLRKCDLAKFQFFISTHSNHLLDTTFDYANISVFTFKESINDASGKTFTIENISTYTNQILELIGARVSSVFLTNCTIWVEGISDRLYIRKFLELLNKDNAGRPYKEDYHYSFVEYGGNNITHYTFLDEEEKKGINPERLCAKLFLIADSDGLKSDLDVTASGKPKAKSVRNTKLRAVLGKNYYRLNVREIENLLTKSTLKSTIESLWGKFEPKFKPSFSIQPHEDEYLGTFIKAHVQFKKKNFKAGTISPKGPFAIAAVDNLKNYNDLSSEAKKLTEKIYEFIKFNNS